MRLQVLRPQCAGAEADLPLLSTVNFPTTSLGAASLWRFIDHNIALFPKNFMLTHISLTQMVLQMSGVSRRLEKNEKEILYLLAELLILIIFP